MVVTNAEDNELHMAWPNYQPASGRKDIFAIISMINGKFRERLPVWPILSSKPDHFPHFFAQILQLILEEEGLPFALQSELIMFLNHCFNCLEVDLVRQEVGKLCSLPIWVNLLPVN
jgi:intron-binding protein aquarius